MRTLAIGDIHGCHTAFLVLMDSVQPKAEDRIIFLGDYIDRGPQSKEVIQWILDRQPDHDFICLRGNHEVMLLEAREDPLQCHRWSSFGGYETLVSYGAETGIDWVKKIPAAHWEFFDTTERYFETATHIFVHAMIDHDRPLEDQDDHALFWERCYNMHPHQSGKKVICGHTPQASLKPEPYDFGACIDTGVYANGWLTCLDVRNGRYWQANEYGERREGTLE